MRVFLAGGTGYVGSAVAAALVRAGHAVTALNRSPEKDRALLHLGVSPIRGDLADPSTYERVAVHHDTIVHIGFQDADTDLIALETLIGAARTDSGRQLVYTSGTWVLGDPRGLVAYENSPVRPARMVAWLPEHEQLVLLAADEGVPPSVVRPG